ncbi:transglutaminase family protein [Novosphingobium sp.]|jgi:transglutaminase-like putative cysteine protease|uniref:transglutaminase family protein n=1 Tax=Novosphingobium sp. TaxID=1874826 RepID=UPI001EB72F95|nr:transglutaminase family protein [Novosphingobium sp.]MBK6800687.1 transglutaminase family protein [Novosphingobium sp.]MBK9011246.1 transglutaminase family protein [Novosphingobium sp.]
MRLKIEHTTLYDFSQPVAHGLQRLRLTPKSTHGQHVLDWRMDLSGARLETEYDDHNHNRTTLVSVDAGVSRVEVRCTGTVATADNHGVLGPHTGLMPMWAFLAQSPLTRPGPRVRAIAARLTEGRDSPLAMLHQLSALVLEQVAYAPGETQVHTSGEEAAALGLGVCQDHAHIFIGAARSLGVPARYVSGYLMMDDRIEQEAGHAWAEAWLKDLGWVGFDISNGISPDERYVRVATGRDYREAAPVTGISWGAGDSVLQVRLAVEQQTAEQ